MIKKIMVTSLLMMMVIFVVGCSQIEFAFNKAVKGMSTKSSSESNTQENVATTVESSGVSKDENDESENDEIVTSKSGCTDNSECSGGKKCIDGSCKLIQELYNKEGCTKLCDFKTAQMTTSDEEDVNLKRGESTYSYAGAISYQLLSGSDYCEGEEVVVPIQIKKITTGKVLNTQVVTVKVGEKSEVITHPTVKRVKFTLEVKSIEEECS